MLYCRCCGCCCCGGGSRGEDSGARLCRRDRCRCTAGCFFSGDGEVVDDVAAADGSADGGEQKSSRDVVGAISADASVSTAAAVAGGGVDAAWSSFR